MNNLVKRVKRVAFGFKRFRNYRIRTLPYAGKPNWDPNTHTPLKSQEPVDHRIGDHELISVSQPLRRIHRGPCQRNRLSERRNSAL